MCTNYYVIAPKIFTIPTPQHASEPAPVIKQRFLDMLAANRAAQLAIRDAALGKGVLHLQPSRNPHANQVFGAVLDAMIEFHQEQATKPAPPSPATGNDAPDNGEPPTEGQPEPAGPAPDGGQTAEAAEAEIAAAFAIA